MSQQQAPPQAPRSSLAVSALWIYPIKSAQGISCSSAEITGSGFFYDRMFMVVRESTGKFLSQRDQPKLALVSPSLPPEALLKGWGALGSLMMVSAPGMPPLSVPLTLNEHQEQKFRSVTCWEWVGQALDMGEDAADWFSELLGMRCRLTRYLGTSPATSVPHDASAAVQPGGGPPARFSSPEFAAGFETRFSDGYPVHLTTEASLVDLCARVGRPVQMLQFRPNIVVSGGSPWEEDRWGEIKVLSASGGQQQMSLKFVKPCDRCKITTLDPASGEAQDAEPLTTLGTFRTGQQLGWSEQHKQWKHALFFGWNVVSEQTGSLSVGDRLVVA